MNEGSKKKHQDASEDAPHCFQFFLRE